MADGVQLKGLPELRRALRHVDKEVDKVVRDAFKHAAAPIVSSAKGKLSRYPGASIGTIGPRVSARGVFVTQRAKKVSGLRGDFGALQMKKVLIPALDEHADNVVHEAERALDWLAASAGF